MFLGIALASLVGVMAPFKPGFSRIAIASVTAFVTLPLSILFLAALKSAIKNAREVPFLRRVWIAGIAFFAVVVLFEATSSRSKAQRFDSGADSTLGEVVAIHPNDHNTIDVTFSFQGTLRQNRISAPGAASDHKPGDTLTIYFLASNPTEAFAVFPEWSITSSILGGLAAIIVLPVLAVGLGGSWVRRNEKDSAGGVI